jgi:ketosteroid isomerase-like protein
MFERFTEPARRTLFFSRAEATTHGQLAIAPEHLLLGMLRERGGRVHDVLSHARMSPERLRKEIEAAPTGQTSVGPATEIPFSSPTKAVLQYAAEEADRLGDSDIAPEHLLLGVLREDTSLAASSLKRQGLHLGDARTTVMRLRQRAPESASDDVAALEAIHARLQDAENAFDSVPIVGVMADDVVLMVPNEPVQEGKAETAAFVARILEEQQAWFDRRITYVSDEISVRGDTAFDRGTFSFTVVAKHDGRTTAATGKYFWLYTRADSKEWRLSRAILSLDDPPEEAS